MLTHINALTAENQRLETRIELGRKLEDLVCRKRKRQAKELNAKDEALARLKAENVKLREYGQKLESALNLIDESLMDPEQVKKDTAATGGPVSMYSVDYDAVAVVERVVQRINRCCS